MTTTVFWLNLRDETVLSDRYEELLASLPVNERRVVSAKKMPALRVDALGSKLLQRYALSQVAGEPRASVEITTDKNGKRFHHSLPFNTSHEGSHVVVAVAPSGTIGIDVAKISENDTDEEFLAMVLTSNELGRVRESGSTILFSVYWSIKEAFLKFKGTGLLAIAPTAIEVLLPAQLLLRGSCNSDFWLSPTVPTLFLEGVRQDVHIRLFRLGQLTGAIVADTPLGSVRSGRVAQSSFTQDESRVES